MYRDMRTMTVPEMRVELDRLSARIAARAGQTRTIATARQADEECRRDSLRDEITRRTAPATPATTGASA